MLALIFATLWFFLPAFLANMAPVVAAYFRWLPGLARPLDGGRVVNGQRLLGDGKTIRGLVVGILSGSIGGIIQYWWYPPTGFMVSLFMGAWIGFGALLGDALKSFVKRRRGIPSGTTWKPWDQIDIVIGVWLVSWWWSPLSPIQYLVALIVIGSGMYISSEVGVRLRIKQKI